MPIHSEPSTDTICAGIESRSVTPISSDELWPQGHDPMVAILTTGSVGGHLFRLAAPMASGMLAVIILHLTDAFFVGRLGTEELAAISFAFPVVMAVGSVAVGLGVGVSAVVSCAVGRGDIHQIRRLTTDSILLSILIVGLFVGFGLATIDPLFRLLGADEPILSLIRGYMRIWYPGMIFLVVPMIGNNALRAAGDAFGPSLLTIGSAGLNIVLDPILIFGLLDRRPMGIAGAAVAATIARAVSLLGSLWILHYRKGMLDLSMPRFIEVLHSWRRILRIGFAAIGAATIIPVSSSILTAMMSRYGSGAVAAFGVATRIESFAMFALYALSASLVPFLGQNLGAGRTDRMRRALGLSFGGCIAWGLWIAAILAFAARPISRLFDSDPSVIEWTILYLRLVPISFAPLGLSLVAASVFNALGQPIRAAMLTALRTIVTTIPLACLGGRWFGPPGIFVAIGLANVILGISSFLWLGIRSKSCFFGIAGKV